jgi:hypothetical protein
LLAAFSFSRIPLSNAEYLNEYTILVSPCDAVNAAVASQAEIDDEILDDE